MRVSKYVSADVKKLNCLRDQYMLLVL